MIIAAKGYVSGEAEEALANALKANATSPRARYYSGLALAQNGRPDVAYRMWIGLLEEGPEDAPWMPLIRGQIGPVARAAGINTADFDAPGPSADDVEAASQMSSTDRAEMIRGMVAGLAERLATEGGTPNEWARLIRAYGTLGETGKASVIWNEARETFADNADALAVLLEAAQAAEVAN
jgi:cytochrome c-type biogenesis protein CcmH